MKYPTDIIHMRNIPGKWDNWRALDHPLPCEMWEGFLGPEEIPENYEWNGNSSGLLAPIFPKWNHPIASCRHDWRCEHAKNPAQRKWADEQFRKDVASTSWKVTAWLGYVGVRLGALLGVGVNY